jgi:hypothetical protein
LRRAAITLDAFLASLPTGAEFGEARLLKAREGLGLELGHIQAWVQNVIADARVAELGPDRYRKLAMSEHPQPRPTPSPTMTITPSPAQLDEIYGACRQTLQSVLDIYGRNDAEHPEVFLS